VGFVVDEEHRGMYYSFPLAIIPLMLHSLICHPELVAMVLRDSVSPHPKKNGEISLTALESLYFMPTYSSFTLISLLSLIM
jgi:hypothetical protein